ncbi:phospholipase D family protein [Massilia sp. LXY-6]|uniref:phospholipase D family protein n=1 Tax=Massilia sp. LXY-6 TaxID=3379823 RepID=UPI003EE1682B
MRGIVLAGGLVLAFAAAAMFGCASLPRLVSRTASMAFPDTAGTRLGTAIVPLAEAHPGLSGVYPLAAGRDAFAARALLAHRAERSLDLQYYIWRKDITGTLLLDAVRSAAARGVRVRLLLDDNNTAGLDPVLVELDRDPNIEVRLFNPFALRAWRSFGYLTDFSRLNRRMHNKSFTADNQVTIVGGRNIGDEYFGAAGDVMFVDLDVMAVGPAVQAVSHEFDRYWNSQSAYPISVLVGASDAKAGGILAQEVQALRGQATARAYLEAIRTLPFVEQLVQRQLPLEWADTRLISDDPAKVLGASQPQSGVAPNLPALLGEPQREVDLVSPYFVPGAKTTRTLGALASQGVKVRVLTNSLEATDVAAVHAGYAKRRRELLESGVSLYELRRASAAAGSPGRAGMGGSSGASLHAKTIGVDGRRIFVGSFNLDPRSIALNTEMGFVIDSSLLAHELESRLTRVMPSEAYKVRLEPDGKLVWLERREGEVLRHETEPGTSIWKRAGVRILSWLPIDWLL